MSYPKYPSDLARKNQRLLAKRLRWPDGALEACADLEDRYPGWHVSWLSENVTPGWERPAGFWATNSEVTHHDVEAFREDLEELEAVLAEGVPEHEYSTAVRLRICPWCAAHPGQRPVKL